MTAHRSMQAVFVVALFAPLSLFALTKSGKPSLDLPPDFDLASAMSTLFGNFDPRTESSDYDIPQTTVLDLKGSSLAIGDEIVVQPFWAAQTTEEGRRKVVLLTFSVPKESFGRPEDDLRSFTCHACAPLIGAAVFLYREHRWQVESSRTVVDWAGAWGEPPSDVRIIRIGPQRIAIEMTILDLHGGESTSFKSILVPWKGKVNAALSYDSSDDDKESCGDEDDPPCFSNRTSIRFEHGANNNYFDVQLILSGTKLSHVQPSASVAARGSEKLIFEGGCYRTTRKTGDKIRVTSSCRPVP